MSSAPHLLREACERGDAEGARRALARGGAHLLDDPLGRSGLGPLHVAADRGRLELLRFLIGRGADIHLRTRGGSTPLALASRGGHTSCVKALLMAGADPSEVSGRNGCTALHSAIRGGEEETVRTLVSSGADADLRSLRGISATDLGGVLAPHSWALHTQARILGDQYYLSPTDIDSNYPPLGQMLQTELYMEEAQSMVANRSWPSAVARASAGHVDAQADAVDAQADVQADAVEVQMATLQSMLAETDEAVAANARARAALERQREVERASDMAALHEQDARRQAKSAEMRAEQAARSASLLARIEERAGGVYNARMDTLHDETAAEGARRAAAAAAAAEEASAEAVRAAAAAEAAEMAAASTSDGVGGAADRGGADDVSDRTSPLRMSPARMRTSPVVPEEPEVTGPVLVKGDMVTLARDAPGFFTLRCASCGGFARSFSTEILQCDARVFSSRKPREKWLAQSRSERAGRGGLAGSR